MVAGEVSGDILGGGLVAALRERYPRARFVGIGGERMAEQGFESLYPMETLSVMGLVEVLRHLPELLRVRRALHRRFTEQPPAVFVGIDAPDFNLGLERRLRSVGVPTAHYVSPTVWAWRQGRVRGIARSVDLMLTLLPFEARFYEAHSVPVRFVGHPLADQIPLATDRAAARRDLARLTGRPVVPGESLLAVLPGSRLGEVGRLGPLFLDTVRWLAARRSGLRVVIPCATRAIREQVARLLAERGALPVDLLDGHPRVAMAAADGVLLASGTATLEALLLKRPMVVAYRVAPLTAWIALRLLKISRFALPNLLADQPLVKEFIQDDARVDRLGPAVLELLDSPSSRLDAQFETIHRTLRRDASTQAAAAVADLLERRPAALTRSAIDGYPHGVKRP